MGGDGGTTATQRRFLRGYKNPEDKEESKNIKQQQRLRSQMCAYSSSRLEKPIAACELGNLYSKEKIINGLVEKSLPAYLSHIRGLKDLKNLKFTENPDYATELENDGNYVAEYICPVTELEFNGIFPFVVIWSTGFVLSEKAVREIGVDGLQAEYGPFSSNDIVKLLPGSEEVDACREAMNARRLQASQKKKAKEAKSASVDAAPNGGETAAEGGHGKRKRAANDEASKAPAAASASTAATKLTKASSMVKTAKEEVRERQLLNVHLFPRLFYRPL
jgi:regulator of protease activity HflC (stomatin/prohibitin superfamily)